MVEVVEVTAAEVAVVMGEVEGEVVVGTEDITMTEISTPRATIETGVMEDLVYTTRWSTVRVTSQLQGLQGPDGQLGGDPRRPRHHRFHRQCPVRPLRPALPHAGAAGARGCWLPGRLDPVPHPRGGAVRLPGQEDGQAALQG